MSEHLEKYLPQSNSHGRTQHEAPSQSTFKTLLPLHVMPVASPRGHTPPPPSSRCRRRLLNRWRRDHRPPRLPPPSPRDRRPLRLVRRPRPGGGRVSGSPPWCPAPATPTRSAGSPARRAGDLGGGPTTLPGRQGGPAAASATCPGAAPRRAPPWAASTWGGAPLRRRGPDLGAPAHAPDGRRLDSVGAGPRGDCR